MTDIASSLRRGGLALVLIAVGGFAADFAFNVGLTHLLPAHEFGDYRVAHAFAAFFGVAVLLGGDRAAPKALAGPLATGATGPAWEYLRFYLGIGLALSTAVIAVTWAACILFHGSTDFDGLHPIALLVVSVPLHASGAMASRGLQAAQYPLRASVPWRLGAPLLVLGLIGLTAWWRGGVTLPQIVALAIVTVFVVSTWQWWQLWRLKLPRFDRAPEARVPRRWLATSVPMMGAFLVVLALNQSDLYFLEMFGQEHEVGHYAAAATSAHFLLLIQTTVVGLMAPLIQLGLEEGTDGGRKAYRHGQRLMLAGLVPAAVGLALAARPVLALFGDGYLAAVPVLELLVLGNLAWAVAALSTLWLQYTERGTVVVAIAVATLVVDSALNALLIPAYGMAGAAAGTAVTMILAAIAVVVARRRGGRPGGRPPRLSPPRPRRVDTSRGALLR